ncbi:MAG: hypothetical protein E7047_08670 [Lentisphaerae bacterium]|nr:hypothetical protein [Lentisphaerota bacterium]
MTEDYASSKYTVSAYFAMVDFLRRSKKYPEAQTLLDTLDKLYSSKHPEIVPEILYDRAVLCGEVKDHKNMLKALEKLTLQHASSALAPQAFFLLGDLQMLRGEYKAALSAFQQAHERSGGGAFAFCCLGRTADAAFALYSVSREAQYLRQATEGYENLLKVNDLPSELYVQTLYKYGRCLNEVGNKAGALHCYRKLLYSALLDKQQNRYYSLHWSAKALDAALKLLGAEIRQEKDERKILALYDEGVYLLNVARVLGLDNEDIETRLQALQKLRRKAE